MSQGGGRKKAIHHRNGPQRADPSPSVSHVSIDAQQPSIEGGFDLLQPSFDRLWQTWYPSPAGGGVSSTTDYEQSTYDAASNILQDRRRDGQVNTFTYDAQNRKITATLPFASTFAYDNLDRLTSATRGGQTLTYGYDALGRQTSDAGAYGTFGFRFDLDDRLTRVIWPDNFFVNYVYDAAGEVTQVRENGAISMFNPDRSLTI